MLIWCSSYPGLNLHEFEPDSDGIQKKDYFILTDGVPHPSFALLKPSSSEHHSISLPHPV